MPISAEAVEFSADVARLVHAERMREAAQLVADGCDMRVRIADDNPKNYLPPLQIYLHYLLNNGGMSQAAQLLWTPTQFNPKPQYTKDVWQLFDEASTGLIMGAASCSKSFGMGVRMFLEWIRDPEYTTVRLIGPSEDHLEANLFSHLVSLHTDASIPMPGNVGELFIGRSRRNALGSIKGLIIPVGQKKKAGRLQGTKRKPRPHPHPQFGNLSRLLIFVDEAENVPGGVWSDIDNVIANLDDSAPDALKIFMAYNPTNPFDPVGVRAEPIQGWAGFDIDKDYRWKSKRGWNVLRLDGEKSENVLAGVTVFEGLQTRAGLSRIASNAGGVNSPGYLTMGRGAYPKQSLAMNVISAGKLPKARGEFIWYDKPKACGGVDLALEGGAVAVFTVGKFGLATGIKFPPCLKHLNGHTEMFRVGNGPVTPRFGIQADQQIPLPKGDTVAMKDAVIDMAQKAGIRPEFLCVDRTGNGAGVHDLIKNEWSTAVIGVNYSQSPTASRIMTEDEKTCEDEFDRIDSELWFALNAFMEFSVLLLNPSMDMTKLNPQLTQRLYNTPGGRRKVESKKEFKSRGYESPDEADSLNLFVHSVRVGAQLIPSMLDNGEDSTGEDDWDGNYYEGGSRVDPSNETDTLID